MASRISPWTGESSTSQNIRKREISGIAIATTSQEKDTLDSNSNELYAILKPFQRYMQLFGLHYDDWNQETVSGSTGSVNRGRPNYQKWYCLFTVLVNWALFLSYLVLAIIFFRRRERLKFDEVPMMMSVLAWHLQNAGNSLVCYRLCSDSRFYRTFFARWLTFDAPQHARPEIYRYARRVTRIALVSCVLFHIPNSIAWIIGSFDFLPAHSDFRLFPVDRYYGTRAHTILHRLWGVTAAFTTPAYVVPLWLFYLVSAFLNHLYDKFNVEFNADVSAAPSSVGRQVELYRGRFERLNQMVRGADYNLSAYLFVCVLTNMCILCSITYRAIYFCSRGVMKVVEVYWCLTSVMMVGVVSYVGAMVSQSAHSALCDLNSVPQENLSYENRQLVSLFSYRLSGPLIAFTAWGFFYITKTFVLTLFSTFISYFFLLVGFGAANSTCEFYTAVPDEEELYKLTSFEM